MIPAGDRQLLRELAKRYADLAADPRNGSRIRRARAINGLKPVRPVVWIDEIPWHEMDIDGALTLRCEDPRAQRMETFFRQTLYRWQYIQANMVVEPFYRVSKSYEETGIGLEVQEEVRVTNDLNHIISHQYEDQLQTEAQVERLHPPILTARPDLDQQALDFAREILDGILPVELHGHGVYYAPWDITSRYRGVEPILIDMVDRPEFVHSIIAKFTQILTSQYDQMMALGLLDWNVQTLHCTPPYVDELPAPGYDGTTRFQDLWFRGMAQMFSTISPAMHEEFDLDYMRPMMDRCGLSYYGCCEPLDNKLDILKKIPNLRKIGVSPWADQRRCAQEMGDRYVFARKPNPAFVAGDFDEETVRRETRETLEICLEYNCPLEMVLKDISTVSFRPQNLISWNRVVQETIDQYYGKEEGV